MHPWSADETRKFITHVDATSDEHATLYRLALTTGMRR